MNLLNELTDCCGFFVFNYLFIYFLCAAASIINLVDALISLVVLFRRILTNLVDKSVCSYNNYWCFLYRGISPTEVITPRFTGST